MKTTFRALLILLPLALAAPAARAQDAPSGDVYQRLIKYDYDQSRKDLSEIEEQIRSASPEQQKAIESQLLAALKSPDATVAARQFICRMLQRVGSAASVPALAELLGDADLSHSARLALQPMQEPAAAAALRNALGRTEGELLIGVITSIGQRRDAEAVSSLRRLATQEDVAVAAAAITALGHIGTPEAAKALDAIASSAPDTLRSVATRARIRCAGHLAAAGRRTDAIDVYRSLSDASQPAAVRAAAIRGMVLAQPPADALKLIVRSLEGEDAAVAEAALSALSASGQAVKSAAAEQLASLTPFVQSALLAILNDQTDIRLRPGLVRILAEASDEQVRAAAADALLFHGKADDVPLLVKLAAGPAGAEVSAARNTLQRMGQAGVDEALIKLAESGEESSRVTAIRILADRQARDAIPSIARFTSDADAAVAAEAVKAIGAIGDTAQLSALAAIILDTDKAPLRTAAENALKSICSRAGDKAACAREIVPALKRARSDESRIALLRVLSRIGDSTSLAAVREAIEGDDPALRAVAVRELADWPEMTAAPHLLEIARDSDDPAHAILALRGYLRLAAAAKDRSLDERIRMHRDALAVARRPEEKKQVLSGLAELPSIDTLELIQEHLADPALSAEATAAATGLARQLAGPYNERALAVLRQLRSQAATDEQRKQIVEAIADVEKLASREGQIVAWAVAGPYTRRGRNGAALFDIVFPPENGDGGDWRPLMIDASEKEPWIIDLKRLSDGNDRVAYLRTIIHCPRAQSAILELGSDDGVKAWLNGQLIHTNNAARAVKPGDDKVNITLNEGANILLLKITQGAGEWGACARVRLADGRAPEGLTFSID